MKRTRAINTGGKERSDRTRRRRESRDSAFASQASLENCLGSVIM